MAITLLSIAIVLLLQAAAPELARLRQFDWFARWLRYLQEAFGLNGFFATTFGVLFVVCVPVLLVWLLSYGLSPVLFGVLHFAFGLVALFFCMGPRDWREDLDEVIHAFGAQQRSVAVSAFGVAPAEQISTSNLIEPVLAAALKRQFAPIFWFACFGAAGVLTYRLVQLLADDEKTNAGVQTEFIAAAKHVEAALAWMPAQLMCAALALASDFDAAARAWKEHHDRHGRGLLDLDLGFLASTVKACIDLQDVDEPEEQGLDTVALQLTQKLVGRITLAWLMALSIVVLAVYLT